MIQYLIPMIGPRHVENREAPDALAAALSSLCLVHCLVLPIALVLAPTLAGVSRDVLHGPGWLHWAFLLVAAPVSVYALWRGVAVHGAPGPWRQAAIGFLVMAGGALAHDHVPIEQLLTVTGGLLVAHAHWRNWKARTTAF
jgi:hypothetical protein